MTRARLAFPCRVPPPVAVGGALLTPTASDTAPRGVYAASTPWYQPGSTLWWVILAALLVVLGGAGGGVL